MKPIHIITIASTLVLATAVYFFFPLKKNAETKTQPQAQRDKPKGGFDMDSYIDRVNSSFSADSQNIIKSWLKEGSLDNLVAAYHAKGESIAEAYFLNQLAEKNNSFEQFQRAGDLFEATAALTDKEDMSAFLIENAIAAYQKATLIDSGDVFLKMKLASSYIEQGSNPMQGISMLLDIVKKDPNNADAQLMLGKFAMMSGQFEKAIERLEKVVYLRPQSNDALFLLAMAHQNLGHKDKAIELLEKCSKNEKNPELRKEIEGYIKQLRKS
jgi:tetratricopeptide (TPR) repeat protein